MTDLSFNNVMIGSAQPEVLGEFYAKVFDRPADMKEDGWYGWHVGAAWFSIGEHTEVKDQAKEPQRVILNFETKEVKGSPSASRPPVRRWSRNRTNSRGCGSRPSPTPTGTTSS
jgi:hypothetical protein